MRRTLRSLARSNLPASLCLGAAPDQPQRPRRLPRSIALLVAAVLSIFATGAPSAALAHSGAASTVRGHIEEDSVAHDPAAEPRLERRTSAATARDAEAAAAAVTGDEGEVGQWGSVVDWSVVGVHVALLANGKVLAYDSVGDNADRDLSRSTTTPAPRCGTPRPAPRRR